MERITEFLKEAKVFYVATADENGQPSIRPIGDVLEYNGKTYLITDRTKGLYKDVVNNPKVAVTAWNGGLWLRVTAVAVPDESADVRDAILAHNPGIQQLFGMADADIVAIALTDGNASVNSFQAPSETFTF